MKMEPCEQRASKASGAERLDLVVWTEVVDGHSARSAGHQAAVRFYLMDVESV